MTELPEPLKYLLHDIGIVAQHCGETYIVEDGDTLECVVCHKKWKIGIKINALEIGDS